MAGWLRAGLRAYGTTYERFVDKVRLEEQYKEEQTTIQYVTYFNYYTIPRSTQLVIITVIISNGLNAYFYFNFKNLTKKMMILKLSRYRSLTSPFFNRISIILKENVFLIGNWTTRIRFQHTYGSAVNVPTACILKKRQIKFLYCR